MPKTRSQKKDILKSLEERIAKAKSIVFANFSGFGVKDNEAMRKELKAEQSEYLVAKKTLLDLAFKQAKFDKLELRKLTGQVAAIFGYGDEIVPAKIVAKYKKNFEGKIEFSGGILENRFITAAEVNELAKLPGREDLYAKLVGSLNAPVSGFVNVIAGNLRGLVNVLKAVADKK